MVKADPKSNLSWVHASDDNEQKANRGTIKSIRRLIRLDARRPILKALSRWAPEDIVDLIMQLPLKPARALLDILPGKTSSRVLAELRPQYREAITREETIGRLRDLILGMTPEAAFDTFQALPDAVQDRLAPDLKAFDRIQASLAYDKESAGEIMQRRFVALPKKQSAAEAVAALQGAAEIIGSVDTVFVIDAESKPIGAFKPRALLLVTAETPLSEIMVDDIPIVSANTDQEAAVRAVAGTGFKSLPVVDHDGRLIGQITPKRLERIIAEESTEDFLRLGGVAEEARATDSAPQIVRNRLPWLLAGLIGATVAALVIGSYKDELEKAAILAAFIPVVMSMAGNAGLQASVVSVQALATGASWPGDRLIFRFARELMGALLNGAIAGSILACMILAGSMFVELQNPMLLALTASLSLLSVTTIAAIVGAFVPLALNRAGIDPAAATGVFITTSNDVVGVLVYFLMASAFYF